MKPRFLVVGTVKNQPTLQKSQSNKDYCTVDIESVWTEYTQGSEPTNVVATYRVVLYEQKALDFTSLIREGQIVEMDCTLSATQKPANDGGMFINYSISGLRFERVRSSMAQQRAPQQQPPQRPAPQQQRQAPAPQYQQPRQSPPPNYPTNPQYDNAPSWATDQQGYEETPF